MTYDQLTLPNIAFIGRAGAGKSTAAQLLADEFNYLKLSFAAPLREVAVRLWGEDARNDRTKLQCLGVAVREIEPDTWVDLFTASIKPFDQAGDRIVVDDCRFENEVWRLAEAGFVFIRVKADRNTRVSRLKANGKLTDEAQLDHISETTLDGLRTRFTVWNDGGGDLRGQLIDILNEVRR